MSENSFSSLTLEDKDEEEEVGDLDEMDPYVGSLIILILSYIFEPTTVSSLIIEPLLMIELTGGKSKI